MGAWLRLKEEQRLGKSQLPARDTHRREKCRMRERAGGGEGGRDGGENGGGGRAREREERKGCMEGQKWLVSWGRAARRRMMGKGTLRSFR